MNRCVARSTAPRGQAGAVSLCECWLGDAPSTSRPEKKPRPTRERGFEHSAAGRVSGLGGRCSCSGRYLRAGRAAGCARWRVCTSSLCRLGRWRRVGEGTRVRASSTSSSRWLGRRRGLAVVRSHLVLRQAQLVVVHLASPCSLGCRFGGLGGRLGGRGRQLGGCHSAYGCRAQRQQRGADA